MDELQKENELLCTEISKYRALLLVYQLSDQIIKLDIVKKELDDGYTLHKLYYNNIEIHRFYKKENIQYRYELENNNDQYHPQLMCNDKCYTTWVNHFAYDHICNYCVFSHNSYLLSERINNPISLEVKSYFVKLYEIKPYNEIKKYDTNFWRTDMSEFSVNFVIDGYIVAICHMDGNGCSNDYKIINGCLINYGKKIAKIGKKRDSYRIISIYNQGHYNSKMLRLQWPRHKDMLLAFLSNTRSIFGYDHCISDFIKMLDE
jgi:hypothetical protein